jgi:hypothetical protein
MRELERMGITQSSYDSYMDDNMDKYDDPSVAEPNEKNVNDKLLLDIEEDGDFIYNPNRTGTHSTHGDESLNEDHLNDEMETYEQERSYEDMETLVRRYGMDVKLRKKETSEDPEESLIYLDIVSGNKKLLAVRINSVGDIEVGDMTGDNFVGEPLDSVEDFIEIFGEDLTNQEKNNLDMDNTMMSKPQRTPEKQPNQPDVKPGKPDTKPPSERPSKRPFTAPPGITPGEEPGPKAGNDKDVEFE